LPFNLKGLAALVAAPKSPKNRWSDKAWRDAIRVAVLRAHEDPKKGKKLQALADALVDAGLTGDVPALREIGDRLDGKPTQTIEANITDERMVVRAPEQPADAQDWASKHGPH
jgi:hypothetical protein